MRKKSIVIAIILCLVLILSNCSKGNNKNEQDIPATGDDLNTYSNRNCNTRGSNNQTIMHFDGVANGRK